MGRMLGSFDQDEGFDRPDLNKCPWCGCFFADDTCTLCGRVCPEEMRAGHRAPVKTRRRKKSSGVPGRVTFMAWYHSWWFILIMAFVMPIAGIVLLATSPYKKSVKVIVIVVIVAVHLFSYVGIGGVFSFFENLKDPVDTSLSRQEYIAVCETVSPEDFYRDSNAYKGEFVSMTLVVEKRLEDADAYSDAAKYTTYYLCRDGDGNAVTVLIRDCVQDSQRNYLGGDQLTVYGEGAGNVTIYANDYNTYSAPCLNVAYVE